MTRRFSLLLFLIGALLAPGRLYADAEPGTHTVYAGQTLGMISKRYLVTIDAICNANGITRRTPIKPGQKLVIPTRADKDGELARAWAEKRGAKAPRNEQREADGDEPKQTALAKKALTAPPTWKRYVKPARRKGYVTLRGTGRRWSGYAIVKGNRISGRAEQGFRRVLYSWRTGEEHDVDAQLIRLLTTVSDTFGGRPLRVASGFREHSYARESKHKTGRACDFSVEGVPNEALFQYLSTLEGVGVGYYPNSTFVHLDVRPKTTHWVDHAAPGEAPKQREPRADAGPE